MNEKNKVGTEVIFGSTREPKAIYKLLANASKKNIEKKIKKKTKLHIIKKKFPTLNFLIFFVYSILLGKIFSSKNFISLKYRGCNIGRYAHPTVVREIETGNKSFLIIYLRLKYFFLAGSVTDTAYSLSNNICGAYVDHGVYLNGIYMEVFLKKNLRIYSNGYPKGLFTFKLKKNSKIGFEYENLVKIGNNKISLKQKNKVKKIIKKKITDPNFIPWMKIVKYKKIDKEINFDDFEYILYPQSFTDAQLNYGYDGYASINDWLVDTLRILRNSNKKVLVKPHPNFYDHFLLKVNKKTRENNISYRDYIKYRAIKREFNCKNIKFLELPYSNIKFLKKLNKNKHIIITHHSSAILETSFFGFKCISSSACFWNKKISITNDWDNIEQYKKILNTKFKKLKYPNKENVYKLFYGLYYNHFGPYGDGYYIKILTKLLNLNELDKYDTSYKKLNEKILKLPSKTLRTIDKISNNIEEIVL